MVSGSLRHSPGNTHDFAATLVFWWLASMALAALAACVILPEWRGLQALHDAEQIQRHRRDTLQAEVNEQQRLLDAMRSDPAAIARLAQRDLGYVRPGDRVIPVAISESSAHVEEDPAPFEPDPLEPPAPIARILAKLPPFNYDAVFCDERTRPIILTMAVSLIAIALLTSRPRKSFHHQ